MALVEKAGRNAVPPRITAIDGLAAEVLERTQDGFYAIDRDWRFILANRRACEMWGTTRETVVGRVLWERFPQMVGSEAGRQLRDAVAAGTAAEFETLSPVVGRRLWLRVDPIRPGITGVHWRDVTDRQRAEDALRESEERLTLALEAGKLGTWELNVATGWARWSERLAAMIGRPGSGEAGASVETWMTFVPTEDRDRLAAELKAALSGDASYDTEFRVLCPDGTVRWLGSRGLLLPGGGGKPARLVGVAQDVTERKRHEGALRKLNEDLERQVEERARQLSASRARLRAFFDNSPDWLTLLRATADGRFVYEDLNPTCEQAYGLSRDQVIGRTVQEVLGAEAALTPLHHLGAALRTGLPQRYLAQRTMAGRTRTIDVMFVLVPGASEAGDRFIITTARDITDHEQLEERLRHAQKMEAVGQLTGGVAHDFNNLLTAVISSLDVIAESVGDERMRSLAETALRSATRGAQLTQQLLSFARRQTLHTAVFDMNGLLLEMAALLQRAVGETIELSLHPTRNVWSCEIDPAQFEAAIMNLVVNARDAMPGGGRLTLATANAVLTAENGLDLPAGDYVELAVTDTGSGMAPDVQRRAFEPFYTTKEVGRGSGLGLSMVHGFVRQSGGAVQIASTPGAGTAIRIYLPRATAAATALPRSRGDDPVLAGTGKILVVEDDEDVRDVVGNMLEGYGYELVSARTALEALELLRRSRDIDLLLTDVVMPGELTGVDLGREARRMRPGIKVLLTSGYAAERMPSAGAEDDFPFIAKPYRPAELLGRIREALGPDGRAAVAVQDKR